MKPSTRKAMFANIKGHKVRIPSTIVINTGNKDRHVQIVEQHMGGKDKICVKYHGKKSLVSKSSVVF